MNLKPLASLVLLVFFIATLPVWAKTIPADGVCPVTLTGDLTVEDCGALEVVSDINLAGHKLTLKGITGMSGTANISAGNGNAVFDVEVVSGKTVTQTSVLLGNIKFVKRGAGTWTLPSSSTYSGGTEVHAGVLNVDTTSKKISSSFKPYGSGTAIDIHGGTVEGKAFTDWSSYYVLNLRGGTFKNVNANNTKYDAFDVPINVLADSTYASSANYSLAGVVTLNNNTLTMSETSGNTIHFNPASISQGKVILTGSGSFTLEKDCPLKAVDISVGSSLRLNGKVLDVGNFALTSDGAVSGTGSLRVHGIYKPSAPGAYYPKMMDGSTLDLSGLSAAATPTAANFDSGTVTIALGDRTLASGQQIVSWTAAPEDVTFIFTGNNIGDKTFVVSGNGIVYDASAEAIETAVWTGAAEDGDYLNPRNWTFLNATGDAVPVTEITKKMCENLTVALSGDVSALTMDATFPFAKVRFSEAFLSSDTDWSSFDICKMADGSVLDVKGRRLTLPSLVGDFAAAVMITNSAAKVSLDLTVAAGNVFTNSALSIMGNFDVVKRGGGTFVAEKYPQEYAGVTIVSNGVLRCKQDANLNATNGKSPFGLRGAIDIAPNGVLDPAGSYAWSNFTINMRGGIISNTVEQTGFTGAYNTQNFAYPFDPLLCLYADTLLTSTGSFNFKGRVAANGHKMRLRMCEYRQTLTWAPIVIGPAEVVCLLGKLKTLSNFAPDTPELTLVMDGATFDYGCDLAISNYVAKTSEYSPVQMADDARGKGEFLMNISGTFTPMALQFYGCTMRNGSTIFLAGKEGAWSTTTVSKSQNGKQYGRQTVDFEDDATVTIDIGARELKKGDKLVSWAAAPANLSTLKFVLRGSALASNARLDVREDGIYAVRKGLVLTIR